jgi:serine kinase of HPr protein (carbohydrate metabolism regulator)
MSGGDSRPDPDTDLGTGPAPGTDAAMKAGSQRNLHATAISIGGRGLMFVGPSGSGKSMLAFSCLSQAKRLGAEALLVADDQIFLRIDNGRVIASRPSSIAGLIELRGSGIVTVESVESVAVDLVVQMVDPSAAERLPPENERFSVSETMSLPMIRMSPLVPDPIAWIAALAPFIRAYPPF